MNHSLRIMALLLPLVAFQHAAVAQTTYTVGVVPQFDVRSLYAIWQPILGYLSEVTDIQLKLKGAPSIPKFENSFSAGEYDLAYMNPYHLLVAHKAQGYEPLVRDVGRQLYGIIVVAKDSPIEKIEDLAGKVIAFPAPNALGAALIPRAEFARKFKIEIDPRYVLSHSSVYLNVALGQADAGGGVQKTLEQQKPAVRNKLRVLYETSKVAPHPIAIHPRVPSADREKLRAAFLAFGATETGRRFLAKVPIKQIGAASLADYAPLNDMNLDAFYVKETD
jgi:phosphonate transport system substrate-binding protein